MPNADGPSGHEHITEAGDAIDCLLAAVNDTDEKLAVAALLALGNLGGPRVNEALLKVLRGELLQAPQITDEESSGATTTTAFPTSTLAAIQAQSALSITPSNADWQARHSRLRGHAARLLGACHEGTVSDALLQVAQEADADPELQREVLVALGQHADPATTAVLMQGLSSECREVRLAALEALGHVDVTKVVTPLIEMAAHETDSGVLQGMITLLGASGDAHVSGYIAQHLHDDDRQIRRAALRALAELGDSAVISRVRDAIFEFDGDLRMVAVSTLQRLGDTALPRTLLTLLDDPDREAHHWIAIEALAEFYQTSA